MNKIPAKQIYLLSIIIVGIITLSVYSTYAIFTHDSSISNVVSFYTPKSLSISENIYEYQQIKVGPNSVTTTDIDIINTFDYDVCYSIWYKIIGSEEISDRIQIFEKSDETITSSGKLSPQDKIRVNIVIVNDNDTPIKINLGTIGNQKQEESCTLNLTQDKQLISASYSRIDILREKILEVRDKPQEKESSYITYKNQDNTLTYKKEDKILVSSNFTYKDEVFTLDKPQELTLEDIINHKKETNEETNTIPELDLNNLYMCSDNKSNCQIIHKINNINKIEKQENNQLIETYNIDSYDILVGYLGGENGIKKVNDIDYIYYGDNPDNYIYYNCKNSYDTDTCELWRIVGLFYNPDSKQYNIKIIRNESIGKYSYNEEDNEKLTWKTSSLINHLNNEYKLFNNYNVFTEINKHKLEEVPLKENIINKLEETNESSINLLNLSDYLYASSCNINNLSEYKDECSKNNWLNNPLVGPTWTQTAKETNIIENVIEPAVEETTENETEEETLPEENPEITETAPTEETEEILIEKIIENKSYAIGNSILETDVKELLDVRPVVFLKSRMLVLDGDGTFEKPFVIK